MAHPWLGLMMLLISAVMLYTRDNFLGIPTMVLYSIEKTTISWEQSYATLHAKLGVGQVSDPRSNEEVSRPDSPPDQPIVDKNLVIA